MLTVRRRAFTLKELIVCIGVIGAALALYTMNLSGSRTASRRTMCTNNLKFIGLAMQNFHDIRQECPPAYLTTDTIDGLPTGHPAWPVVLMPYIEQMSMYGCWAFDSDDQRENLVFGQAGGKPISAPSMVMSELRCPTRHQTSSTNRYGGDPNVIGFVGDYAVVAYGEAADEFTAEQLARPLAWDGALMCSRAFNPGAVGATGANGIALGPGDFRSMTNYADIVDGLSYTAFVGEKALKLGNEGNSSQAAVNVDQDGCVYYAGGGTATKPLPEPLAKSRYQPGRVANCMRSLGRFSAGSFPAPSAGAVPASATSLPQRPWEEDPNFRFGSWHNGVTMFVLGDGSVRVVNNDASEKPLQRLATRNDGHKQIDLP